MSEPNKNTLYLSVKSPTKIHFEGQANAVSSVNDKGKFDVLAYHENFISLIQETLIIIKENKEKIAPRLLLVSIFPIVCFVFVFSNHFCQF